MFYTNVLFPSTGFDPTSSLAENMTLVTGCDPTSSPAKNVTLVTGISSSIEKQGLFFTFIAYTK